MNAIQEQFKYSIEQCIRDNLDQDTCRDNAIRAAAHEIACALNRPVATQQNQLAVLIEALDDIQATLTIPAAEYVPAIGDVFKIIDRARKDFDPQNPHDSGEETAPLPNGQPSEAR